jgi:hypothetical protein
MITPLAEDKVEDNNQIYNQIYNQCQNAPIWCPNHETKYPDPKPMGYPFDRMPYTLDENDTLEDYVKRIPNMKKKLKYGRKPFLYSTRFYLSIYVSDVDQAF